MTQYFKLLPQKFGFVSRGSIAEMRANPDQPGSLEFIFDVLPEDDMGGEGELTLMTERLVRAIQPLQPTGVVFRHGNLKVRGNAKVESGTDFASWWIADVTGAAGKDDFGYESTYLVVSERVMHIIKDFTLRWCQIELH